jgi:hypothetical protein
MHRTLLQLRFESVGKCPLDESGKYPVNEDGEEILAGEYGNRVLVILGWCASTRPGMTTPHRHCERSEAIHLTA